MSLKLKSFHLGILCSLPLKLLFQGDKSNYVTEKHKNASLNY